MYKELRKKGAGVQHGQKRGEYQTKNKRLAENYNEQDNYAFKDGMSYYEIAAYMGITVAEVKKIEKQALRKLAAPTPKNKAFLDFLRDRE